MNEEPGKEVKTMKYEKPEITSIASAIEAVQNSITKCALPIDSAQEVTVSAYESDEG